MKKREFIAAAAVALAALAVAQPAAAKCYGLSDCGPNYNPPPAKPYTGPTESEMRRKRSEAEREIKRMNEENERRMRERSSTYRRY